MYSSLFLSSSKHNLCFDYTLQCDCVCADDPQGVRSEQKQRGGEVRQGASGLRPKQRNHPDQRGSARKLPALLTLLPRRAARRTSGRPGGQSFDFSAVLISVLMLYTSSKNLVSSRTALF